MLRNRHHRLRLCLLRGRQLAVMRKLAFVSNSWVRREGSYPAWRPYAPLSIRHVIWDRADTGEGLLLGREESEVTVEDLPDDEKFQVPGRRVAAVGLVGETKAGRVRWNFTR